jgi:predicted amidohydrolase
MRCWLIIAALAAACVTEPTMAGDKSKKVRIAVCQIVGIDGDREGNYRRIEYALEQAARDKADIACFPESILFGWQNPSAYEHAEPIPGADSDRFCALAKKYDVMIAVGLDEKAGDRLYDACILVDRKGKLLLHHRKCNILADLMDPPYLRGDPDDIKVVETEFGRIGMVICADTFIDENIERVAKLKPDLMFVPYGWAAEVDKWPGHNQSLEALVCKIARAWKCPVVGTDLVGQMTHGPWRGRTFGGASVVANAKGKRVAKLRDRDVEIRTVKLKLNRPDR